MFAELMAAMASMAAYRPFSTGVASTRTLRRCLAATSTRRDVLLAAPSLVLLAGLQAQAAEAPFVTLPNGLKVQDIK